jgi:hypothetical protein
MTLVRRAVRSVYGLYQGSEPYPDLIGATIRFQGTSPQSEIADVFGITPEGEGLYVGNSGAYIARRRSVAHITTVLEVLAPPTPKSIAKAHEIADRQEQRRQHQRGLADQQRQQQDSNTQAVIDRINMLGLTLMSPRNWRISMQDPGVREVLESLMAALKTFGYKVRVGGTDWFCTARDYPTVQVRRTDRDIEVRVGH